MLSIRVYLYHLRGKTVINWLLVGYELARLFLSVLTCALLFRKFVAPSLNEGLADVQEAVMKITNVAKLAGVKSQEYKDSKGIEQAVARDIINEKVPELEALKVFVSPATWEEIEDTIDNNPEAILQLWQKYGHLLGGAASVKQLATDY